MPDVDEPVIDDLSVSEPDVELEGDGGDDAEELELWAARPSGSAAAVTATARVRKVRFMVEQGFGFKNLRGMHFLMAIRARGVLRWRKCTPLPRISHGGGDSLKCPGSNHGDGARNTRILIQPLKLKHGDKSTPRKRESCAQSRVNRCTTAAVVSLASRQDATDDRLDKGKPATVARGPRPSQRPRRRLAYDSDACACTSALAHLVSVFSSPSQHLRWVRLQRSPPLEISSDPLIVVFPAASLSDGSAAGEGHRSMNAS